MNGHSRLMIFWFVLTLIVIDFAHAKTLSFNGDPIELSAEDREKIELLIEGNLSIDDIQNPNIWLSLSGGDIIGNGGGLVESHFQFALQNLHKYIQEYLITNRSMMDINDYVALASIANVVSVYYQSPYALIFMDEDTEIFNNTEIPHRIAVTGSTPGTPILINRTQLYSEIDGSAALSEEDTIALLIHEFGHQIGIENHSYLDRLGNYIKSFIVERTNRITTIVNEEKVIFSIKNPITQSLLFDAKVIVSDKVSDVKELITKELKCPIGMKAYDVELYNLHWLRSSKESQLTVGLWADLVCQEIEGESLYVYGLDLSFAIDI